MSKSFFNPFYSTKVVSKRKNTFAHNKTIYLDDKIIESEKKLNHSNSFSKNKNKKNKLQINCNNFIKSFKSNKKLESKSLNNNTNNEENNINNINTIINNNNNIKKQTESIKELKQTLKKKINLTEASNKKKKKRLKKKIFITTKK